MEKITSIAELQASIALLETQQAEQRQQLKEHGSAIYESLQPINFIRNTFRELKAAPDIGQNFVDVSMGLAAGYVSKKIMIGNTHNPFKKLLGTLLEVAIVSVVSKHTDTIKSVATYATNYMLRKKEPPINTINTK